MSLFSDQSRILRERATEETVRGTDQYVAIADLDEEYEAMRRRASELGAAVRREDGVGTAVRLIEGVEG